MNRRKTVSIELNVFAQFRPAISPEYRRTPFVFLGNMSPELQIHVGRTLLKLGPKYVTIKKGEHGCLLMSANEIFQKHSHFYGTTFEKNQSWPTSAAKQPWRTNHFEKCPHC